MIQPNSGLLRTEPTDDPVRLKCTLSLTRLFPSDSEREKFKDRLHNFLNAPRCHPEIFQLDGDHLIYSSEQLIPEKKARLSLP